MINEVRLINQLHELSLNFQSHSKYYKRQSRGKLTLQLKQNSTREDKCWRLFRIFSRAQTSRLRANNRFPRRLRSFIPDVPSAPVLSYWYFKNEKKKKQEKKRKARTRLFIGEFDQNLASTVLLLFNHLSSSFESLSAYGGISNIHITLMRTENTTEMKFGVSIDCRSMLNRLR